MAPLVRLALPAGAAAVCRVAAAGTARPATCPGNTFHPTETVPKTVTAERLAERICRRLGLPTAGNAEMLSELLREALTEMREAAITSARTACLQIAEEGRSVAAASEQRRRSRRP